MLIKPPIIHLEIYMEVSEDPSVSYDSKLGSCHLTISSLFEIMECIIDEMIIYIIVANGKL